MRLNILPALVLLAALSIAGGCKDNESGKKAGAGSEETKPAAPASRVVGTGGGRPMIGFITRPGWGKAVHAGANKALEEGKKGADGKPVIGLLWQEPEKTGEQAVVAKGLLEKGVAAIVIAPDDIKALGDVVAAAGRVPVIAIDSKVRVEGMRAIIGTSKHELEEIISQSFPGVARGIPGTKELVKAEGVNFTAEDIADLKSGKLEALIVADPMELGALAVQTASDCIKEKQVEMKTVLHWIVVTKQNMKSPENEKLLNPPVDKYLHD
jgi:ABC-type sugar transport system substrate-binding protein